MSEYEIELYKIIGEMIRERRVSKGYTLDEIAEKIDVTKKTIQRYETGERKIKIATLLKMSEILGFDYDDFMEQAKKKMVSGDTIGSMSIKQLRRVTEYKTRLDTLFNNLNQENKDKVLEFASRIYEVQQMEEPLLNAANPLPGATDDDKKHDDDIMDDF